MAICKIGTMDQWIVIYGFLKQSPQANKSILDSNILHIYMLLLNIIYFLFVSQN